MEIHAEFIVRQRARSRAVEHNFFRLLCSVTRQIMKGRFSYLVFLCCIVLAHVTCLTSAYRLFGKEQNKANKFSDGNADPTCKPNPLLNVASDENCLIQSTLSGFVRGTRQISSANGNDVDAFLGIPYAKPPLGELRFRKPEPVDDWQGVHEATQLPNACSQEPSEVFPGFSGEEMWNPNTPISEDCLYLNLWVPTKFRHNNNEIRTNNNATVMIWIHGGGYTTGSSSLDIYDGLTLAATNDVIVASFNYRLGALGFLYLGTEEAPGNMGLYDQAMAMQWIKDNIHFFGGSPDDITVFSESAGSGSLSSHLLSPISSHLIKRAIIQSGVVTAPWSHLTAENARNFSLFLAKDVGCYTEDFSSGVATLDEASTMNCLRGVDPRSITQAQGNSYSAVLHYSWAPTIDGVFLPKHPKEILEAGEFNNATEILLGTDKDEGSFFLLWDFLQHFNKDEPTDLKRETFIELVHTIFSQFSPLQREAIIFQYTDWTVPENGVLNQKLLSDAIGDYYFTCPVNWFAQKLAEHGSKVYNYHYTHLSSSNPWGSWLGVKHGDELEFTFGHSLKTREGHSYTEDERQLSLKIMKYFTEFAKTGTNPMEKEGKLWPQYSRVVQLYATLNTEDSSIGFGPRATTCAFWNEMIPTINKHEHISLDSKQCQPEIPLVQVEVNHALSSDE